VSHFRDLFTNDVETGEPGGKPPKKKVLFVVLCLFDIFCFWVETGVPGVKPPTAQIPASRRRRCLGLESDGQSFVHLADWALNTSSPEGLEAGSCRRVGSCRCRRCRPTGPEQELTRGRDGAKRNGVTCALTDPLLAQNPSTSNPLPCGLRSFFRYQSS